LLLAGLLLHKFVAVLRWLRKNMSNRHAITRFITPAPEHLEVPQRVAGQRFEHRQHHLFQDFFVNPQGLWIYTRRWEVPVSQCLKGLVLLVHGFGEHCSRYDAFARCMASEGLEVHALDHQGHGRSEGDRAYCERFDHMVDDVITLGRRALAMHDLQQGGAPLPLFMLGHSMGGLITTHAAQRAFLGELPAFKGAVLSGPALKEDPKMATPTLVAIGTMLSGVLPKAELDPLPGSFVSRDPVVVEHYMNDPLVYTGGMRARTGIELLTAMRAAQAMAAECKWPMLLMQGDLDRLVLPEGAQMFYDHFGGADKELKMLKGQFHEIFNEPGGMETLKVGIDWMLHRSI